MEDKPPQKLETIDFPIQYATGISSSSQQTFKGKCDPIISRVTIEVVRKDGSAIPNVQLGEQDISPPFKQGTGQWSSTLMAGLLPVTGNPSSMMDPESSPYLRLRVRFYEPADTSGIPTTLLTTKFFTKT